jgi:hypothetical protein
MCICTKDLNINLENIRGTIEDLTCTTVDSDYRISFKIRNSELTSNGKDGLKYLNLQVYDQASL